MRDSHGQHNRDACTRNHGFRFAQPILRLLTFFIPGLLTHPILPCFPSHRLVHRGASSGRHAEDGTGCGARGRGLSPRAREALGCPSAPTMRGCLEWLDGRRRRRAKARPRLRPEARVQGLKSPQSERREAPLPDRKGRGDASQASRAIAPIAQEADRKASAFPGAPLPSLFLGAEKLQLRRTRRRSKNTGDAACADQATHSAHSRGSGNPVLKFTSKEELGPRFRGDERERTFNAPSSSANAPSSPATSCR
jgi:hypothetical protein